MKIFANHAHLYHKEIRPHGDLDSLKKLMDDVGLDGVVAFAPFNKDGSIQVLSPDENQNRWLAEELKGQNDIIGFGTVNFDRDNLEDQVKEIAELGFKGIKLHPQHQLFRINGEKAYRVYGVAEELGLFLSFHTGIHYERIRDSSVLMFDDIAWDFPKLRFSMEHMGGYSFFRESIAVMNNQRNAKKEPRIFAGWTSIYDRGQWYISPEDLCWLLELTGDKAHIFGLDFPHANTERIAKAVNAVKSLPIPETTKELILGGNLMRELGL
ncbi:MAG: amidohydrolase family protein [Clostridia bacterium]|nr:amidohydrolase family protein [Clostridia bacterium]